LVPNHPRWPLIIYRGAVELDEDHDPAAVIEDLFEANGWAGFVPVGDESKRNRQLEAKIGPGAMRPHPMLGPTVCVIQLLLVTYGPAPQMVTIFAALPTLSGSGSSNDC
jgi:hypothetical protein